MGAVKGRGWVRARTRVEGRKSSHSLQHCNHGHSSSTSWTSLSQNVAPLSEPREAVYMHMYLPPEYYVRTYMYIYVHKHQGRCLV